MTRSRLHLKIRFLSFWLCGTGKGAGMLHDAIAARDDDGLPYVPGRHLRGLLRDAMSRMPEWTGGSGVPVSAPTVVDHLFGARPERDARSAMPEGRYFGGLLRVSDARLTPSARQQCLALDADDRAKALFSTIQSTAVERSTGTAKDRTLRALEVANPIVVIAEIDRDDTAAEAYAATPMARDLAERWDALIVRALPLVRAIGSSRTRGLGRCIVEAKGEDR